MENLQNWGFMGDIRINSGFYWGNKTGIYYDILGRVCDRLAAGVSLCKALGARLPGGGQFVIAFGVTESQEGDGWHAYPAGAFLFCKGK